MSRKAARKAKADKGRRANTQVVMTGCAPGAALPTSDPADRAHDLRDQAGFLQPAAALPESFGTPREYPEEYMVRQFRRVVCITSLPTRRVVETRREFVGMTSFESHFEDIAERERRLQEMGLMEPTDSVGLQVRYAMAMLEVSGGR